MVRKALIVEDEEDTGQILAEHLRRWGFEPTVLTEGKPVVPWVQQHHPDLILLDLLLPTMLGMQVCQELRAVDRTCNIPIIMTTQADSEADELAGLTGGADDYVAKPYNPDLLVTRIQKQLRRKG